MTNIFCTKKLEKVIGKNNIKTNEVENIIGNWNANVFYINRRKCLFLINEKTCYSVIFPNFIKKDIPNFNVLFYDRFFDQLRYDKIEVDIRIATSLMENEVNFMKTNNNRKVIGTMTQFIKDLEYFLYYHDEMQTLQELNHILNDNLVTMFSDKKYEHMDKPIDLMQELLNETRKKLTA